MSKPIKFLLVDDIEENLVALEALLKRDALEIFRAKNGNQALELLLQHDFALAFIDVQMPEMDGFELAELMRGAERSKHVPIIFVTAGAREQHRIFKGYESGAVDFLFKPIDPHILRHKANVFFELYRQRQQLAQQVEERELLVNEMKETLRLNEMFTAALGHDLRNPLGAIMTGAELLIRRRPDEKTVISAKRIRTSGARMAQMIDQLLDLARARLAGGIPIERKTMDLKTMGERIVSEHRATEPQRQITLDVSGFLQGYWDETRLAQVLSNLIANALRHGQPQGAVEVRLDGSNPEEVQATVTNAGCIRPGLLPHLFDPFRSGEDGGRRSGLGLGLYIVDQIVKAHQGEVHARSNEAEGTTTFALRLPRHPRIETETGQTVIGTSVEDNQIRRTASA